VADLALIDGVLVVSDIRTKCLRFTEVDSIPGLKESNRLTFV
jgi:hypothetical protein